MLALFLIYQQSLQCRRNFYTVSNKLSETINLKRKEQMDSLTTVKRVLLKAVCFNEQGQYIPLSYNSKKHWFVKGIVARNRQTWHSSCPPRCGVREVLPIRTDSISSLIIFYLRLRRNGTQLNFLYWNLFPNVFLFHPTTCTFTTFIKSIPTSLVSRILIQYNDVAYEWRSPVWWRTGTSTFCIIPLICLPILRCIHIWHCTRKVVNCDWRCDMSMYNIDSYHPLSRKEDKVR